MRDQGPLGDSQRLESLADEFFADGDIYEAVPAAERRRSSNLGRWTADKNPTSSTPVQRPATGPINTVQRPVTGPINTVQRPATGPIYTVQRPATGPIYTVQRPATAPVDIVQGGPPSARKQRRSRKGRSPSTSNSENRTAIRAGRLLIAAAVAVLLATLLTQTTAGNQGATLEAGPDEAPQVRTTDEVDTDRQFIVIDGPQNSGSALRRTLTGFIAQFGRGESTDESGEGESQGEGSSGAGSGTSLNYQANLDMIRTATVRNRNHDNSPYINTASADLKPENHYGPRSEYLNNPGDNPEQAFPIPAGGQFRVACEFSHFSYDDPLLFPNMPGAAHLHMFFGNTDVNAFSSYDSLVNSGSSTCNGQELNRTGYWAPAVFDGQGNVRIPERVVVYYKGEGQSRGASQVYPEGAAMITHNINTMPGDKGGSPGKLTFACTDNFSTPSGEGGNTMPACDGSKYKNQYGVDDNPRVVLEVNIKFPQCWNGQDPANWRNFQPPSGNWYGSNCSGEFNQNFPNLEYFINYVVDVGENTSDWFISSDVNPDSLTRDEAGGASIHADWWGGWHRQTNQTWIDNCVNYASGTASGCGFGYLTDGGPNGGSPSDGPALKLRPQYDGPYKVPADQLLQELCPDPAKAYSKPEDAAYCAPGTGL